MRRIATGETAGQESGANRVQSELTYVTSQLPVLGALAQKAIPEANVSSQPSPHPEA